MKFTIVTTVLLGLLLTPALAAYMQNEQVNQQTAVAAGNQILSTNRELHVATVEQKTTHGSWKTIWNYDKHFIVTRVLPEKVCFISMMNKAEMLDFEELPMLAEESKNMKGQRRPAKEITLVTMRPVRDLRSYGPAVFTMCRGLKTYMAYEVNGRQYIGNQESCIRLKVLQVLGLNYCRGNTNA
ncbi:gastrokine-1 [Gymnogyps californianus]|uniref:gastrokine-1 n=1 Tax=Gymnogyps californianus TaxID=33616 RepID=UPI0021CABDAF|nr:gastrokine-1 [Gymnogyps californianus]